MTEAGDVERPELETPPTSAGWTGPVAEDEDEPLMAPYVPGRGQAQPGPRPRSQPPSPEPDTPPTHAAEPSPEPPPEPPPEPEAEEAEADEPFPFETGDPVATARESGPGELALEALEAEAAPPPAGAPREGEADEGGEVAARLDRIAARVRQDGRAGAEALMTEDDALTRLLAGVVAGYLAGSGQNPDSGRG